ncbi:restriction endonuclease subunit S [Pseudoduganella plicata]|uniref:Type I restriction-modification system specificity subunit n=1 Tax=Pseudoduganella plicata TaxID=321984 RepID=A0AA88CCP4_9BURK|nr:restriction endonuclease subunit S [Pseudoduganella plicata]GGY93024.1 type I restriction-modification system specificity subunit [Pseudoduganella plicata]
MSHNNKLKPGWKVWRFDQMATNVNARIDNPSESGMKHYVGLEHLDANSLKIRRWGTPSDVEATKLMFKTGDIIFGRRRAYQRKLGIAEFDGICSAHAMVLRAKPDVVIPEFLPFFMQSDIFMNRAVEISVGSLSPTINWKTMAVQEFALPPIDDQLRIVGLLREIESNSDNLIALVERCSSLIDAIFQHYVWSDESLTKEPISQIAEINPKVSSLAEDDPFIPMEAVDPWAQLIDPSKIEKKGQRGGVKAQGGDLLMARITPCLENGKIAQVPISIKKCGGSTEFIVFRAKDGTDQQFIYHLITSRVFHSQAAGTMSGSTGRQRASATDVGRIVVPILPLTKQIEICDQIKQISKIREATNSRLLGLSQMKLAVLIGAGSE